MSEFLQPASINDALVARSEHPDYEIVAGGTDLYVASKDRAAPTGTIDLFGIPGLCEVEDAESGGVKIGAATTYATLLSDPRIAKSYPVLREACREVGAAQIQARGTIGGNMVTSSPVGDSLPPLLALDAEIEVASKSGSRRLPYADFLSGYRKVDLREGELLVAIHLPAPHPGARQYWRKVGTRRAQSISKVMVAALAHLENGVIAGARVALGAVADRTVRAYEAEKAMMGKAPGPATAKAARDALRAEITPIDDLRSTADYRLEVAENIVARFVLSLSGDES
jgi:CO/xanthine dehydrogenase FAD-binding subunit